VSGDAAVWLASNRDYIGQQLSVALFTAACKVKLVEVKFSVVGHESFR